MARKLYVLARCSICRGKIIGCMYCDRNGETYVEASDNLLRHWFQEQTEERQKELLENIFIKENK